MKYAVVSGLLVAAGMYAYALLLVKLMELVFE